MKSKVTPNQQLGDEVNKPIILNIFYLLLTKFWVVTSWYAINNHLKQRHSLFIVRYSFARCMFFYKQLFFSTQFQCCLTLLWIELQILLRCCLIHIIIITLRHILYVMYFCQCLVLSLFMSYLCDLFLIFSLIFIVINRRSWFSYSF